MEKKVLFITGGAGYVGAMLCDQFVRRSDVEKIVTLDKEAHSDLISELPENLKSKIVYIHKNLADAGWEEEVLKHSPTVVVHTAWQIRELYGDKKTSWKWNIDGSDRVFDFAFNPDNQISKLIYFSTVASYGAFLDNEIEKLYTEDMPFRKTDYLYAEEKRIAEEHLKAKYDAAKANGLKTKVAIVRPAAITGPRGRNGRIRFGLQSALSGKLKGNIFYTAVRGLTQFVPATPKWCRQFIHEDDVNDIVETLVFSDDLKSDFDVFNICPPGEVVRSHDMAKAVNKKALIMSPYFIRLAFFFAWHLSRGKITTSRGAWKSYSYPIAVDGSKISKAYNYDYKYKCKQAFEEYVGRYADKYKNN